MFDKKIFRDTNIIDYHATPMSVIFKVVRYGSLEDFKNLLKIYKKSILQKFLDTQSHRIDKGEQKLLSILIHS